MQFRKDINGLRAIAVIAVVLFHFNLSWMPGGFAGVDVFFVISGFLMTGIIFRGLEQKNFSLINFYISRANRIIPALALLCLVLMVLGWFFFTPIDYRALGKHAASSIGFISNVIYWREAGYFDAASHEKWLLHTWSLSVEWQFYILYPLVLVAFHKFVSLKTLRTTVLLGTALGFILCVIVTYKWPNFSYYLLPTRAWEMMAGGVAYLYPIAVKGRKQKIIEWTGIALIISSYLLIKKETPWPGYIAGFPVLGSFLIIQAQRNDSFFTSNKVAQKLGSWSYSIYLWHWPLVVAIYYLSLNDNYVYLGIILSGVLGFLSKKYIENIYFPTKFKSFFSYLRCVPLHMVLVIGFFGSITFLNEGFIQFSPSEYQLLVKNAQPSPYRKKCHIEAYRAPKDSCEYFKGNISWATFGDSHTVEIAWALAKKLEKENKGLKHFSFSGCKPSYKEDKDFHKCSEWYNETITYLLKDKNIQNIVFSHRFTSSLFGGDATDYPQLYNSTVSNTASRILKHIDDLIYLLAENKKNVYVFYPIPELQRNIHQLIGVHFIGGTDLNNVLGTDLAWYKERNKHIIQHFENSNYPSNVHLLNSQNAFCDTVNCYAVVDGNPLYFDDNHPSIMGATRLVELIE